LPLKTLILDHHQIQQKLDRLAYQVYEAHYKEEEIIVAGIEPKGASLANRLAEKLKKITNKKIGLATLRVNKDNPLHSELVCEKGGCEFEGKSVVLVDDVLNTGRTMIYGIKYFLEYPIKQLSTVVLVDRDHKKYPVRADYIGLSLSTNMQEHVEVEMKDGNDAVYLM
jgi:pyrimidine operon attenuation protein / uracil phosphoribosyltransferase